MRTEVLYILFLSIPLGLLIFMLLTRSINAHLIDWKDKIRFFFWPFPPFRMLVIQELDDNINVYYDWDYEEIQSKDKTIIQTIDGNMYVTEIPPSKAAVSTSMFDARAPDTPSPFSVAWRWVVAFSILIYMLYYAFVVAWIPPMEPITVNGIEVFTKGEIDPTETLVVTTAFFTGIVWFISNIMRMMDRTIMYSWYHAKGINPPHTSIIPVPGVSSVGMLEYLSKLGRQIVINIPQEAVQSIEKILDEMQEKVGTKNLAAIIMAKLAMANTWRQTLTRVLREGFAVRKAAEADAMIRMNVQSPTKRSIPYILLAFLVGLGIGYLVFNNYGIQVAPVNETTSDVGVVQTTTVTPGPIEQANTTTVTPAQPPPPPGVS